MDAVWGTVWPASVHLRLPNHTVGKQKEGRRALSLIYFGSPCAWHPQGPIHPQPSPVPLHIVWPTPPRVSTEPSPDGGVGPPKCSGTGWLGGRGGPLWVPGPSRRWGSRLPLQKLSGREGTAGDHKERPAPTDVDGLFVTYIL